MAINDDWKDGISNYSPGGTINDKIKAWLTGGGANVWTSYTPSLTGSTTNPTLPTGAVFKGIYKVVGDTLHLQISYYSVSTSGGASGTGAYLFGLPNGYLINLDVVSRAAATSDTQGSLAGFNGTPLGAGVVGHSGGDDKAFAVAQSSSKIALCISTTSGNTVYNTMLGAANFSVNYTTSTFYKFSAEIPIVV